MIEFAEATSKRDNSRSYFVGLEEEEDTILGCVWYSHKEGKLVYSPFAKGDSKGNYHLAEIAELIEFLNKGRGGK